MLDLLTTTTALVTFELPCGIRTEFFQGHDNFQACQLGQPSATTRAFLGEGCMKRKEGALKGLQTRGCHLLTGKEKRE
jgi:hypothetical protein